MSFAALLLVLGCDEKLTFDAQGVPHGSGEKTYTYKTGATKLIEHYEDGELIHSRWFRPNGTPIQETRWFNGAGEAIYVREDGSIARRIRYLHGVAEGEATEYDEAGKETKILFRGGSRVETASPATRPAN